MKFRSNYWKLLGFIFSMLLTQSIYATDYYVSSSGSDGNSGTSISSAWATISKVNATTFQPGDALYFEGGKTFSGNISITTSDANNPNLLFTISSYGGGVATINAGNSYGFYAHNTQGFSISNLIFDGNSMNTNTDAGIKLVADITGDVKFANITISNLEIKNFGAEGVSIYGGNHLTGFINLTMSNIIVHDVKKNGIKVFTNFLNPSGGLPHSNIHVSNCEAYNVPGSGAVLEGNGIAFAGVDGGKIEYSTAHDNGQNNTSATGPVGIWTLVSNDITIQYCESYNNHSGTGGDGGGFDLDGGVTNSFMQYNYSHDNDGSGFLFGQFDGATTWNNNTFRYNISENDARTNGASIALFKSSTSASMTNAYVYNNTVFMSPQASNTAGASAVKFIQWSPAFSNVFFYNNIFYTTGGVSLLNVPFGYSGFFAGNIYWTSGSSFSINYQGTNYTSLDAWRSTTGNEIVNGKNTGLSADPLLSNPGHGGTIGYGNSVTRLNAYKIQNSASPATSGALDIQSLYGINVGEDDFWGSVLPGGSGNSIGANQFSNTLPLDLVSFYGSCVDKGHKISWTTGKEIDVRSIDLLTSVDNRDFITIATFTPKGSHSDYSYINDSTASGINYYMLKMTDSDGATSSSSVLMVRCDELSDKITIGPNPFNQYLNISIESSSDDQITLTIFDGVGKRMAQQTANAYKGFNQMRFDGLEGLPIGMYYLQVRKKDKLQSFKILKNSF